VELGFFRSRTRLKVVSILLCALVSFSCFPALALASTLLYLQASPSQVSVDVGKSIRLVSSVKITGVYSDGTTRDLTYSAAYTMANSTIANLPGNGTIAGVKAGVTTLYASYGGKKVGITVKVNNPVVLQSLKANVNRVLVNAGDSIRLVDNIKITGLYSNGSSQDVTYLANYSMANPAIARLPGNGTIVGVNAGTTTLYASYQGKQVGITVVVRQLKSLTTNVSQIPVNVGSSVRLVSSIKVTGVYSDGSTSDLTYAASYQMTDSSIARLPGNGYIVGVKAGTTALNISYGGKQISVTVKVTQPEASLTAVSSQPSQYGKVIIPEKFLNLIPEAKNKPIPIYVPPFDQNSENILCFNDGTWNRVTSFRLDKSTGFDWSNFFSQFSLEDVVKADGMSSDSNLAMMTGFGVAGLILQVLAQASRNINAFSIDVVIQRNVNTKELRAVLLLADWNKSTVLRKLAGATDYFVNPPDVDTAGRVLRERTLQNGLWLSSSKNWDLKLSVDPSHSVDAYIGYLYFANGRIAVFPRLYRGDKLTLVYWDFFWLKDKPEYGCDVQKLIKQPYSLGNRLNNIILQGLAGFKFQP